MQWISGIGIERIFRYPSITCFRFFSCSALAGTAILAFPCRECTKGPQQPNNDIVIIILWLRAPFFFQNPWRICCQKMRAECAHGLLILLGNQLWRSKTQPGSQKSFPAAKFLVVKKLDASQLTTFLMKKLSNHDADNWQFSVRDAEV